MASGVPPAASTMPRCMTQHGRQPPWHPAPLPQRRRCRLSAAAWYDRAGMRVLLDYRPALRAATGVGAFIHHLAAALADPELGGPGDEPVDVTVFSSSWKDRLGPVAGRGLPAAVTAIDRRIPVRLLNVAWHRAEWPPIEALTGRRFDVVHSPHPLLLPSRGAAQVVSIHDLDFLAHPERARGEIRRDYPALARRHARRAARVVVPSRYTADEVVRRLGIPRERIANLPERRPPLEAAAGAAGSGPPAVRREPGPAQERDRPACGVRASGGAAPRSAGARAGGQRRRGRRRRGGGGGPSKTRASRAGSGAPATSTRRRSARSTPARAPSCCRRSTRGSGFPPSRR